MRDKNQNVKKAGRKPFKANIEKKIAFCIVLIPLIGYTLFNIFPMIIAFVIQFGDMTRYDLSTLTWNNFAHFKTILGEINFWKSLRTTLFLATAQFVSLAVAFFVAVLLNSFKGKSKVFKIVYFIPYICSTAAVAIMFGKLFDSNFGIVNTLLGNLFGEGARVNWFNNESAFPWIIYMATVWQAPGYGIVMYTAALTSINPSLYEAADIDGAGRVTKLFKITFPSVAPTTFFLLLAGIIAGLQTFELPYILAGTDWQGNVGPNNSGMTLMTYIYVNANSFGQIAKASAASWMMFVLVFIAAAINFKFRKRWVNE